MSRARGGKFGENLFDAKISDENTSRFSEDVLSLTDLIEKLYRFRQECMLRLSSVGNESTPRPSAFRNEIHVTKRSIR